MARFVHWPLVSILGAISLAIWWGPLTSSFALALNDERFTHILIVVPISAALIFLDCKSSESPSVWSAGVGSVLLVIAVSVTAVMRRKAAWFPADVQLSASMFAFVLWWIGAFLLGFGVRTFRRLLFPLCLLFWLVPWPEFVMNPVVTMLQQGSAAAAHLLFAAARVPVAQRGMFLHIPGITLEVAPECSSIRSSLMLIVSTMVLAHLLLRSPWRKTLVVAVAIPLSVVKNGLRIFTIAMLATRVDRSFLTGRLHRQGGIIFFLIALGIIFLLLWIARSGEDKQPRITVRKNLPEENPIYR